MLSPFIDELARRVLVCDGAMGTMLYSKGVFVNRCFESLNLSQPDLVAEIHLGYVRAGADVVETNTFGANRIKLGSFGLSEKVRAINVAGARVARHAAREQAWVAGAIGPLGIRIEPWGKTGVDEAEEYFREQAQALLDGPVDLFILETFRDLREIGAAIAAVRGLCDLPIVAQMTIEDDGHTLDGTPPEKFGPELVRLGAHIVGVNCSVGPAPMLETIERLAETTEAPLAAQPNAGKPRNIEGRTLYLSSPEYLASYARRFIAKGVRLVGGCCGTTPEHIRQIKLAVGASTAAPARHVAGPPGAAAVEERGVAPAAREQKSRLAHAMARGKFVHLVELTPPRGHEAAATVEEARRLKIRGVDAVNVPDGPLSAARMSAISIAVLIEQQAGIETLLHYACRDRTLLGMQSDLLGAHAMGVRNLLLVTGDPQRQADYAFTGSVLDVDSIGLTNVVSRLNRGVDVGGEALSRQTCYHVGVAVNPTALNLDEELRRFAYKVEAGAEFAITAPVFDLRAFEVFLARVEGFGIPVVAGLWPFDSQLNAEFMANEVPGVSVPEALLERMRRAGDAAGAACEGVAIAREIANDLRGRVQGFQLGNAAGRVDGVLEVFES
ncbi:MAG: bifunctional homocysteine S-methyltransferase/methylenetetrahydrofolate reductase [Acidobacteria bacterium]|nr:MAG: bifunctional homocysteine S-methyltransferase/methylenetetrahydrofolate reductase [Acidobacteriota bacterium]